ncbi:sigma factor-like helix-turn-helix DNA-binding protein [Corynebacterium sp. AOP34-AQ2-28]|uniref:sigma factor-like helix-turn-helix DNA-binding protein n=1 Tax=Corynebacterium sp. AOP34-AQ2-28 TaxID=3457689 RepID=UPI004033C5C4
MGFAHQDTQQVQIMKRAEKTYSLRLAGFTYRQIGDKLNIGIDTVRKDIERMKVEFPETTARELVAEQRAKLVEMMKPQYLKAAGGDRKAAELMLKMMDHEAKLFRLYEQDQDNGQQGVADAFMAMGAAIREARGQ